MTDFHSILRHLGRKAWAIARAVRPDDPFIALEEGPGVILERAIWESFATLLPELRSDGVEPVFCVDDIVAGFENDDRRAGGIYPTPAVLARRMAELIEAREGEEGAVIDLSAGTGALLRAAITRHPGLIAVGTEIEPTLATAAAIGLWEARLFQGRTSGFVDRIYCADGLTEPAPWSRDRLPPIVAVVGNPPYVGEKGRRSYFKNLRRRHGHLDACFGPRMDLLYLFFHRGLDHLDEGGQLIYLTSEYWLTATGATRLRQDLLLRGAPRLFVRFEKGGLFPDAPGHHSLIMVADKSSGEEDRPRRCKALTLNAEEISQPFDTTGSGGEVPTEALEETRWVPFVMATTSNWHAGRREYCTPLGELVRDFQGFVSGADRLTSRHIRDFSLGALPAANRRGLEVSSPIFIIPSGQIPEILQGLDGWTLRPVLRGSAIERGKIYLEAPDDDLVLYLDGVIPEAYEAYLAGHLGAFRPILERRREVVAGHMPWYRLHWPRRRRDQTGPKLVSARRAAGPAFCLDLSGAAISSDCTYLVAPDDVASPVYYLAALMVLLNSNDTARYLEGYGKRKGAMYEFYSDPLRRIPIPARLVEGRLELPDALWTEETRRHFWMEVERLCSPAVPA